MDLGKGEAGGSMKRLDTLQPLSRSDWGHASLIAAALFVLYAATTPRTIAFEDDGLFVLAAYYQGEGSARVNGVLPSSRFYVDGILAHAAQIS